MSDADEANLAPRPADDSPPTEAEAEAESGLPHFVSQIHSIEEQVGANVVSALKHEGTVAVMTAVLPGTGGERIASVPLDQELWVQVSELLSHAGEEKAQDVPCIGFQCVLRDREVEAQQKQQAPPDNQ